MATQRTLEMDFSTELGRTHSMRVYDAREDVTGAEVAAAMDNIVSKNIFLSKYGDITGKVGATLVEKSSTEISLV